MPPPDEEMTVEQLTALDALVKSGVRRMWTLLYGDQPGHRFMFKLRLTGMQLMPQVELAGPLTFGM